MNESNQKLFVKYLEGKLSSEAKDAFKIRLGEDQQFKKDFELFKSMDSFLTEKNKHQTALKSIKSVSSEMRIKDQKERNPNRIVKILLALLVLGLLCYFGYRVLNKPQIQEYRQYAEVYEEPIWPETRSESSQLSAIISNYKTGNIQAAFDSLDLTNNIPSNVRHYWLAELHLLENRADSSLFYNSKAMSYGVKRDRLIYLKILSNLKLNNTEQIDSLINSLPVNFDPYYLKKIQSLKQ